ncbi:MAG: S8 family peptidase [Gemmatimonadaceae bacterium]
MTRSVIFGAAAGLVLAACADVSGPSAAPSAAKERAEPQPLFAAGGGGAAEVIPGQYVVVFRTEVRDVPGLARQLAAAHGASPRFVYEHALKGFAARISDAAAAALARNPNVAYVEQDQVVRAVTEQSNATWGLDRSDQRALPLTGTYTYTPTGAGVTVYIIDTGIRFDHGEFGGRALSGYDAIDGGSADDCNGHGTHVAGTVGGTTYGIAKGAKLVGVRVLDCTGSGTISGVIAGVDWVTAGHVKPAAANMSLGGGASTALDDAVRTSIEAGVTYAVAAGNDNYNACYYSPARLAEAVTVGATTSSDARASYSNYGSCLDLFAPGSSITSAWYTSTSATNTISGTSMATPHVAGVAALYLEGNPTASPATVRDAIVNTATSGVVTSAGTNSPNKLLFAPLTAESGGGTGDGGTTAPCSSCTAYSGSLSGAGDYDYQPNGTYYYSAGSGYHKGWLEGAAGTDFDLYLYKWNGSRWKVVASSATASASEKISYSGSGGYYMWEVYAYSGSGSYKFWLQKP